MNTANVILPAKLHFTLGGYNAECHEVKFKAGALHVRHAVGAYMWQPAAVVPADPEAWAGFWRAVDAIGVWQWQPNYDNEILDGTQWSLRLAGQGRTVSCGGSNAYPGSTGPDYGPESAFAQFLAALRQLTGVAAFQ